MTSCGFRPPLQLRGSRGVAPLSRRSVLKKRSRTARRNCYGAAAPVSSMPQRASAADEAARRGARFSKVACRAVAASAAVGPTIEPRNPCCVPALVVKTSIRDRRPMLGAVEGFDASSPRRAHRHTPRIAGNITGLQRLRADGCGKPRFDMRAKGPIASPAPLGAGIAQPPTVQRANDEGECWETVFAAPATKSTATAFKDKSP